MLNDEPKDFNYSASHVANFFLQKSHEENIGISQLKLLKLIYIAYGWMLATCNRELFAEKIEAWRHGPVVTSIYNEFKHNGKKPIAEMATEFDLEDGNFSTPQINSADHDARMILRLVWDIYKHFSAWDLRNKTHEQDTPWKQTYRSGAREIIPPDLIKDHFRGKIIQYLKAASNEQANAGQAAA